MSFLSKTRRPLQSVLQTRKPSLLWSTQAAGRAFSNGRVSKSVQKEANQFDPKTYIIVETAECYPGTLRKILDRFEGQNLNITHLSSKMKSFARSGPSFHIDFECDPTPDSTGKIIRELKMLEGVIRVDQQPSREVPWYPLNVRDLDLTIDTLGSEELTLDTDHPGFNDPVYRSRRTEIEQIALNYRHGTEIPRVAYTDEETKTWGAVFERLESCHNQWACKEFKKVMPDLRKHCGYAPHNIPQLADISDYLTQSTGFSLRPIGGLLSARDFLNALAFRTFTSTQYIRHGDNPFYTPEPDICHELMGHVPLFANMDFADFSQEIGLASLAASDEDINALASVYWFTVEFGLLKEGNDVKAFGAGVLSSFGEMEWGCSGKPSQECRDAGGMSDLEKPNIVPFDPFVARNTAYPITTYQPTFFCAASMADAKTRVSQFCDSLQRPFFPQYDALTGSIIATKAVKRAPRTSTAALQAAKQKEFFESANAA